VRQAEPERPAAEAPRQVAAEQVRRAPPPPAPEPPAAPPKAAPVVRPPSAAPAASGGADDGSQLAILLATAGIPGVEPSNDAARMLGGVLRSAMSGLMDMLRVREKMKDELRMRGTSFKAANNNPLKFSANVDDAFHNMFVKHNPAYLEPPEAVEDAFRDVRDHQASILAAMRIAFEATLSEFDPDRMQENFDRTMKKGSILGVPAKLRYWDMFREKYGDLIKQSDDTFRTLFGDEFARAYEQQLERLRAASRLRDK
jgi:type VI secretion system FHA domain protein